MKIAIIDDDPVFSKELKNDLLTHFNSLDEDLKIDIHNNVSTLNYQYTIYFIDIALKDINGIDVARQIKLFDKNSYIVFISSRNELIHDTLSAKAFYFIRKSCYEIDLNTFFNLIDDEFKEDNFISLCYKAKKSYISLNDIIYIESQGHKLLIKTNDQEYYDNRTLKEIINILQKDKYIQIQKSYIINVEYLVSFKKNVITMSDDKTITIGRIYQENFKQFYQEYLTR